MTGENRMDFFIMLLGVCLILILIIILVIRFITRTYMPFAEERDFIRMEIMRTHGNERVHWEHELRRLYLAQIPLIGGILVETSRKRARNKREKL